MTILSNVPPVPAAPEPQESGGRGALLAAGIGSAALLAALLYCRGATRSRKRPSEPRDQASG